MGRELKRVPVDFQWPMKQPWSGYINEAARQTTPCAHCKNGYSPEASRLHDVWYGWVPFRPEDRGSVPFAFDHPAVWASALGNVQRSPEFYGQDPDAVEREARRLAEHFNSQWCHHLNADDVVALLAEDRLLRLTHTWTQGEGWQPKVPAHVPTPEEVNAWSLSGSGHDSINSGVCVEAECQRLGVPFSCEHCGGEGRIWNSSEAQAAAEAWRRTEPPVGDGYQMWETVSEGSPISPVFADPYGLAAWLAANRQGTVDDGMTGEEWLALIMGPGWAPSGVFSIPASN